MLALIYAVHPVVFNHTGLPGCLSNRATHLDREEVAQLDAEYLHARARARVCVCGGGIHMLVKSLLEMSMSLMNVEAKHMGEGGRKEVDNDTLCHSLSSIRPVSAPTPHVETGFRKTINLEFEPTGSTLW